MKYVEYEEDEFLDAGFVDGYTNYSGLTPELVDDIPVHDPTYGRFEKWRPTSVPGLLDGMNHVVEYSDADDAYDDPQFIGRVAASEEWAEEDMLRLRMPEHLMPVVDLKELKFVDEEGNEQFVIGESEEVELDDVLNRTDIDKKYNASGLIELIVSDSLAEKLDEQIRQFHVMASFEAKHQMQGMPTHMDFEGVVGSVDILLQL